MSVRFAITLMLACPLTALGDSELQKPFLTSNLNPFVQAQGLPPTGSGGIVSKGALRWQMQTEVANHFTESGNGAANINLDGETHRLTLALRYGVSERWELGIDIPYIRHTGGSLDSFIENWHDTFGLPNGGREDFVDDQLNFSIADPEGSNLALTRSTSGIGDVRLTGGYQLTEPDHSSWTLRASLKLPTGDADKLTGSGAAALFVSAQHSNNNLIKHPDWHFHASVGAGYMQDGDLLERLQENWMLFGSTTVAWHATERMSLKAQLDIHSALYDSRFKELGDVAAQLIIGGSLRLGNSLLLDISVSEDIITDTSPDVVLQVGLRARF